MAVRPNPYRTFSVDQLEIEIYATRDEMGNAAACDVADGIRQILSKKDKVRMIFAAAASQNEFLSHLSEMEGIDWHKIEAFHMDEYVGLRDDAPQRFGNFLKEHLFDHVQPGRVEYIDGTAADLEGECERYTGLLEERPIDIVCAGIGENGHMAFNDPHVADFCDPKTIKVVTLDDVCRMQQVHDGAFPTIDDVPTQALTLTMSALMSAHSVHCAVPGPSKTEAVRRTVKGPVATECPATIMRHHDHAVLYLDLDAAKEI